MVFPKGKSEGKGGGAGGGERLNMEVIFYNYCNDTITWLNTLLFIVVALQKYILGVLWHS